MIRPQFGEHLNAQSWIGALQAIRSELPPGARWSDGLAGRHLFIDMGEVGFADFVALGHLLVFVRAASEAGAVFSFREPTTDRLDGELPDDPDAAVRRLLRHNCKLYLEQTGFIAALDQIPGRADPPAPEEASSMPLGGPREVADEVAPQLLPNRRRKILPYRWIDANEVAALSLEQALLDLGLSAEDCAAFAKGVLAELLENAARFSGRDKILLGGAIVQPETYADRTGDFGHSLQEFVRWARKVPSPLVRLVVADTGRGMLVNLAETDGSPMAVLRALDRRSTTESSDPENYRGARGLWKVARIVRGYQGGLLITTGGVVTGRVYESNPNGRDDVTITDRPVPGTVVECGLLTRPSRGVLHAPDEVETPVGRPTAVLACVTAPLRGSAGFDSADRERIAGALSHDTGPGLVVAANVPEGDDAPDDIGIARAILQVLALAAGAPRTTTVTLAFPSINVALMTVAIEYVNAEYAGDRTDPATGRRCPVLLLAPENRHFWVGGRPATRRVLRMLSATDQPRRLHDFVAPGNPDTTQPQAAIQEIMENTGFLATRGDKEVSLAVRPPDAADAMARRIGDDIVAGISNGIPGVWTGSYLTLNLRVTGTWCDVEVMLAGLQTEGLAGFALAARIEDRVGRFGYGSDAPIVLRVGDAPRGMVATLARTLTGADDYFDGLDDLRLERAGRSGRTVRGVLLVTDVISTGHTLLHKLATVMDREMTLVGVATVIDAREAGDHTEITFRGKQIPVVSLARVDIRPIADQLPDLLTAIDPVHRVPRIRGGRRVERRVPTSLIAQGVYIAALKDSSAARLGHIERPAGRHYSGYVDPTRMFRDTTWRATVLDELTVNVRKAYGDAGLVGEPVCVLYPGQTTDELPAVAEHLHQALVEDGFHVAGVQAVRRSVYKQKWEVLDLAGLPASARHAIIVDSGTSSGRTIHQLIDFAATGGIRTITAILLLNGLDDADAVALQQIARVRRNERLPIPSGGASDIPPDVPVAVHYVARTAMRGNHEGSCSICRLRLGYQRMAIRQPIPSKIEEHLAWLLRILEPITKRSAFQEQATDLFGTHVSPDDCVSYLRWRYDFREAGQDTDARYIVDARLRTAAVDPVRRDALVRLLTAEGHWLDEAPLTFHEQRENLADIALSLLTGPTALSTDQMLRVQAVILLVNAAPHRFATAFRAILSANRHQEPVVLQTLLEALRLVVAQPGDRAAHPMALVTQPLVNELWELETLLYTPANQVTERHAAVVTRSLVGYLLSQGRRRLPPVPSSRQAAWASLSASRGPVFDHDYEDALWSVITSVDLIGRRRELRDPKLVIGDWATCRDYLAIEVLPNVRLLGPALRDPRVHELRRGEAVRWETAVDQGIRLLDDLDLRVTELIEYGDRDRYPVEEVLADLGWWLDYFLSASVDRAGLAQVMQRCPVDLIDSIQAEFPDEDIDMEKLSPYDRKLKVFCTGQLLRTTLRHIRNNATGRHRVPGAEQRFRIVLRDADASHVTVEVWNTGSRPSRGGRHGLEPRRQSLEAFDARLVTHPAKDEWTFGVAVTLQRWRMSG